MSYVHPLLGRVDCLLLEPGYYADGRFGIRIENVVVVREANTPNNFGDKGYLGFEHLTMVWVVFPPWVNSVLC